MIEGRIHVLGDHVDTDAIIPGQYLGETEPAKLGRNIFASVDPEFAARLGKGDVIVAGLNFGCGSSREQAPLALKGAGIACVVATSFARIFYRNAINVGLPVAICPIRNAVNGGKIRISLEEGTLDIDGDRHSIAPLPAMMLDILEAGGIVPLMKRKLGERFA